MKRPDDDEDAGTSQLRKALKARVRHPYITGQGLDAPDEDDDKDDDKEDGEQGDR